MHRALVLILLAAAGLAAWFFLSPPTEPDPGVGSGLGPGGEPTAEGGTGDTQKGNDSGDADASSAEKREMVQGETTPDGTATSDGGLVSLRGRLVFRDGSPVATALTYTENRFGPGAVVFRDAPASGAPPRVEGASEKDGRFELRVPRNKAGTLRITGDELVMAKANAGVGMHVKLENAAKDLGDVPVARAATVVGRVVAGGTGVEGVEIVYGRSPAPAVSGLFSDRRTKTDADGRFTIKGLVPGKIRMDTRSPEFLPSHHEVTVAEGQALGDVLIKLQQGGVITGTVVDDRGQPVEDATVSAARSRKLAAGIEYSGYERGESTKTDASGQFRLAGLAEATVDVRANKSGFVPAREAAAKAGQANLVLKLARLGVVEGVLVDEAGEPIAGSTVRVRPARRSGPMGSLMREGGSAKTDAEGRFKVASAPPGPGIVVAQGDAHLEASEAVEVRPGETTKGVRVTARRGSTLTVTVLDQKGQPVTGATVTASTPSAGGSGGPGGMRRGVRREVRRVRGNGGTRTTILGGAEKLGSAKTDAAGVAVIRGMPAGEVEITAKHKELALLEPGKAEVPEAGEVAAKLTMQRGGFVEVSVVDAQGMALGNRPVSILGPLLGGDGEEPARDGHKADAEGQVTVGPLAPGNYKAALEQGSVIRSGAPGMSFSLPGDNKDLKDSEQAFVIKPSDTTKIELIMPVLTTVNGTVRDVDGVVEGAEVEMLPDGEIRMPMFGRHKTKSGADGTFSIPQLPSGKYTLCFNRKGAMVPGKKEVVLVKNQPELTEDLVLPGAVVKLKVKDAAEGFGVEEAEIGLREWTPPNPEGVAQPRPRRVMMIGMTVDSGSGGVGPSTFRMQSGNQAIQTDAKGEAKIEGVPAGKYNLTITHPEYARVTQVITVVANQVKNVGSIPVSAGCKVRGKVEFGESAPGAMNMANVEIRNDTGFTETSFSQDGSFRFTGLKAGSYKVRARRVGDQDWGPSKAVVADPERAPRVTVVVAKGK